MNDFDEYLTQALKLCEDYTTVTPDSNTVDMLFITPQQLKKYTKYCISQANKNNNQLKRKKNASSQKK